MSLILAIEDDPAIQRFLRASLTSHDYEPIEAVTGKLGLLFAAAVLNPRSSRVTMILPSRSWMRCGEVPRPTGFSRRTHSAAMHRA